VKKTQKYIAIKNAHEHNLKNVSLSLPHDTFIGISGISGSGKSSLVFDTIAREGQRRLLQTFSGHTRQFMNKLPAADVDDIKGLRPVLTVDQKTIIRNPRSTVGTLSELYDLLRLLFARFAEWTAGGTPGKRASRSLFSFNSPEGACPECKGLGVADEIDPDLLIDDPGKTLREGALVLTTANGYIIYSQVTLEVLDRVCRAHGFNVDIPWNQLTPEQKDIILNGSEAVKIPFGKHPLESRMKWSGITVKPREEGYYRGLLPVMTDILKRSRNPNILRFARTQPCPLCCGDRLNRQALGYSFRSRSIAALNRMTISQLISFLSSQQTENPGLNEVISHLIEKGRTLEQLGLGFLSLSRKSNTLSGGEAQRIRLANQTTNRLSGILYILDEPSIGLHPADQEKLIRAMTELKARGNSLFVVEHDRATLLRADYLVDIGPEAGAGGGHILFSGSREAFENNPPQKGFTHRYLFNARKLMPKSEIRHADGNIIIKNARLHNLKNIQAAFKRKSFNVVCGVAGAGKSTLVHDVLADGIKKNSDDLSGHTDIQKVIDIDQAPIGRTSRSNPATYTKLFDHIRALFAALPEAKKHNWTKSRFSFNNKKGGRCPECEGAGVIKEGFHFLGSFERECPSCQGKRFTPATLTVKLKGQNIADVLDMSMDEAARFFSDEPSLSSTLRLLIELGLGYLSLGQPSTTLSGGEAQRIKLASELAKKSKRHTLYTLDEPSTGLHDHDLKKLSTILNRLADRGHTVVVIEHHPDIILQADHIIELGPGSGPEGGRITFSGTPAQLLKSPDSITAGYILDRGSSDKAAAEKEPKPEPKRAISLKGIRTNNLQNITVDIPVDQITMVTGVSGSGKSSLVTDTIYAEGWQRYIENFSAFARSHMQSRYRADIEHVDGLRPAIHIGRSRVKGSGRSTLATCTGVLDRLRLIFSRCGRFPGKRLPASAFSFNQPEGACPACSGLGYELRCDPEKLITNPAKPLPDGAMDGTKIGRFYGDKNGRYMAMLAAAGRKEGFDFNHPFASLPDAAKRIALFGLPGKKLAVDWHFKRKNRTGMHSFTGEWPGLVNLITDEYFRKIETGRNIQLNPLMSKYTCRQCRGRRYRGDILAVTLDGYSIDQLLAMRVEELHHYATQKNKNKLAEGPSAAFNEIREQCRLLKRVGLGYLTFDRLTETLSGGEMQRTGLAVQGLSGMEGLLCVLDEPGRALHTKDKQGVIRMIEELKNRGNTVVLIEHDLSFLDHADHVIEMGPGGGKNGGQIIYSGSPQPAVEKYRSELPDLLKGFRKKDVLSLYMNLKHLSANNLNIDRLRIPTAAVTIISGVSGSGKSSLLNQTIAASVRAERPVNCAEFSGMPAWDDLLWMELKESGAGIMSTPLTLTGLWGELKKIFTRNAAKPGKKPSRRMKLSQKKSICPECEGTGIVRINMDFLADIEMTCESCRGLRYRPPILEYRLKGLNLGEILQMTVDKALPFFDVFPEFAAKLDFFKEAGLSYLALGQPGSRLSSGEIQRLMLIKTLLGESKNNRTKLILLDEPSAGLHYTDAVKIYRILQRLRDSGHTIIATEHHPVFTSLADYRIFLGPGAGPDGGRLLSHGVKND
jgi:excinuclease ABC subunit A